MTIFLVSNNINGKVAGLRIGDDCFVREDYFKDECYIHELTHDNAEFAKSAFLEVAKNAGLNPVSNDEWNNLCDGIEIVESPVVN